MGSEEIKSAIAGWCTTDELQLVEDRGGPGSDFVLGLRASGSGGSVPVDVLLESGADRVTVRSTSGGGVSPDAAREILESRPALVSSQGSGGEVVGHVYLDGFNRQAFMAVVNEVAKTARLLGAQTGATAGEAREASPMGAGAGAAAAEAATPQQAQADMWSPQPAQPSPQQSQPAPQQYGQAQPVPAAQSLPAPSFGGSSQPQGGYGPLSGQPAPQAQPQQQIGGGFAPTHTVPPQGMQAWAAPDPTGAVVATLGGGLPMQVTEVRGAWARVLCSNGWSGWVDGRIIGVAR